MKQHLLKILILTAMSVFVKAEEITPAGNLYHKNLSSMARPVIWKEVPLVENAVASTSEIAVSHVRQGVSCLLLMWDFEAYRHFSEALLIDPDCLMANWGIAMSLAGASGEYGEERIYATDRALALSSVKNEDGNFRYPDLERRYVGSLAVLLDQGPRKAAGVFKQISEDYPNDLFSGAMSCVLLRQGYDELGFARPDQEFAEKSVDAYLEKNSEDPLRIATYLGVYSVMPSGDPRIDSKALPLARKLHEKLPNFPMAAMMRGHLAWKNGSFSEAEKSLVLAEKQFLSYMNQQKVSVYDCVGRVRSALYAAVAMNSQGKLDQALEKAQTLAAFQIDKERIFSAGAVELLWEGKTMPVRLAMSNQSARDFEQAIGALPKPDGDDVFKDNSLFVYYAQSLALYLQGRQMLYANNLQDAKTIRVLLGRNIKAYIETKKDARKTSSYTQWLRGLRASRILEAELHGFITLSGPTDTQGSAINWFRSASSWQRTPSLMIYPSVFYPQQRHIGGFQTARNDNQRALDSLNEGLEGFPNHLPSLKEKAVILQKLGKAKEAKKVMGLIEIIEK